MLNKFITTRLPKSSWMKNQNKKNFDLSPTRNNKKLSPVKINQHVTEYEC